MESTRMSQGTANILLVTKGILLFRAHLSHSSWAKLWWTANMEPSRRLSMVIQKHTQRLLESTKPASLIWLLAELMRLMRMYSRTRSARPPSTLVKSKPILIQNAKARIIANSRSMILMRRINSPRTTSQKRKKTQIVINLHLNSSCSTPVSNLLQNKKKRMTRSANKLLSSCLSLSFSS